MKIIIDLDPLEDLVVQAMDAVAHDEELDLTDDRDLQRAVAVAWQQVTQTGAWKREAEYVNGVDSLYVDSWHAVFARCGA